MTTPEARHAAAAEQVRVLAARYEAAKAARDASPTGKADAEADALADAQHKLDAMLRRSGGRIG